MSIRIKIPDELGRFCNGRHELDIEAATFDGIAARLIERFPDVGTRLLGGDGHLLSHLIVFHNGTSVPTARLTELAVAPNDELEIMFLASGG
ncbi:MAG: MoaD/ThiS family protein [Planctomycetaceae bacterium]|jgi:hypothetical protein|nr:MoaD/ThiS family protein [Planctomycetaceae bacterium]MBT6156163.1 MoaD/ThiS family protein [Planctomycetaceae bacterium]MBT6484657.1 MoaD/ThiS family protein [Planctomycetaceae bacterium]MBT6493927.1 MoaD/ThiS family protein [Planctomycetaceae bacterium]